MKTKNKNRPHVVVLGAGFGGLAFCRKMREAPVDITLVDRQNHHLFQPLLYQVATAGLASTEIAYPIRNIFKRRSNLRVVMGTVIDFNLSNRRVMLRRQELPYDYLVVALGGVTGYFGNDAWAAHAPGLKNVTDALRIRHRLLMAYERAETEADPDRRRKHLTAVVVGGGPTGVELAGSFAELARRVLRPEYRHAAGMEPRILLLEAGPRVLPTFSERLSASAEKQLRALGVEVRTGAPVTHIEDGTVTFKGGRAETDTVVWAAGVQASPITRKLGVALDRAGRIPVEPDLRVPGHPDVFAIGDIVQLDDAHGRRVPGVAPAAMQMGHHVATVLREDLRAGKPSSGKPFAYFDKGSMATIGRSRAVAQVGKFEMSGFPAWLAWLFIHLMFLVGFHNKLFVFLDWLYAYATFNRGARLIIRSDVDNLPPDRKYTKPNQSPLIRHD